MSNQALQQKRSQPVIAQYLERYKDQIEAALPRHMTPDRMVRIVLTEMRKVPKLAECNPKSLFGTVIQVSQLGLEPGNTLGHAYLIPFGKEVNLIIGYRGMIDLARRSGQIISIEARAVYEQDEFAYSFGLTPDLKHTPSQSADKGALTHVYAVARLKGGGLQWDVMTLAEVEAIRAQSKAGRSGPWVTHFDEMAKKTVIRRLFKYLPVSIEMQTAIGLDEQADAGVAQKNGALIDGDYMPLDDDDDTSEPPPATKTDAIKGRLKAVGNDDTDAGHNGITYAYVAEQIGLAATDDELDLACDLVGEVQDPQQRKELIALAGARKKALQS